MLFPLAARAGVLAEAVADRARTRIGQGEAFEVIWTWCPAAAGDAPWKPGR